MVCLEAVLHQAHRGRKERKRSWWQRVGTQIDRDGGGHSEEGVEGCEEGSRGEDHRGKAGTEVN